MTTVSTCFVLTTAAVAALLGLLYRSQVTSSSVGVGEVGGPSRADVQRSHQDDVIKNANTDRGRSYSSQDLGGQTDWLLTNNNGSISAVGPVPGNVYTALQQAGLIQDPYYRFNDDAYRWISSDSWSYSRSFSVTEAEAARKAVRLLCNGLDTIATIYVNNIVVGSASNQFVGYVFDVTSAIQPGTNTIRIAFQSAVNYSRDAFNEHPYLVPPTCPPAEYHPECHANFIRKAQCSFSWDWGPAFPTQGIWDRISLETFDNAVIRHVTPYPFKDVTGWALNVSVYFDVVRQVAGQLKVSIVELQIDSITDVILTPELSKASITLSAPTASPWWPRGYGDQTLYSVEVTFTPSNEPEDQAVVVVKTGFRTVEIIQDAMPVGLTFYFKVNDVPVFMKGSNWIPVDSFLDKVTYPRYRNLLESAVNTNMNSIRIWGGGVYEKDEFYDIADELGLLIWQDMMFACSMYPTDTAFLKTVDEEMQYQVKRLSHHPSLVAWTANNENEGALVDNWYGTAGSNYNLYKQDYVTLYVDTIRASIVSVDPNTRPFLSSSPTNGMVTEGNGWISESPRPSDPNYGDVHYYNYNDDCLDYTIYPKTRYASEYGYQSWPSYQTLEKISVPSEDLFYGSQFWRHREHHQQAGNGTEQIINRHFVWPNSGDIYADFKHYIYLTQIEPHRIKIPTSSDPLRCSIGYFIGLNSVSGTCLNVIDLLAAAVAEGRIKYLWRRRLKQLGIQSICISGFGGVNSEISTTDCNQALTSIARVQVLCTKFPPYHNCPVAQALCYQTQTEFYRRSRSDPNIRTMGALYWQHNDIWQAPSWSTIDYDGRWKVAHYFAGRFFADPIVSIVNESPNIAIYTVNDHLTPINQVQLVVELWTWSTLGVPLYQWISDIDVLGESSNKVFEKPTAEILSEGGCTLPALCFLTARIDNGISPTNAYYFVSWKDAQGIQNPNIQVTSVESIEPDTFLVSIHTSAISAFTWIETQAISGRFSDNGFLMTSADMTLTFYAWQSITAEELRAAITVTSLYDVLP